MPNLPIEDELRNEISELFEKYESVVIHAVTSGTPDYMNGVKSSYTSMAVRLIHHYTTKRELEADRRTLETLAAILTGTGHKTTGERPQDEKKTIEIALSYIRNKLELKAQKEQENDNGL